LIGRSRDNLFLTGRIEARLCEVIPQVVGAVFQDLLECQFELLAGHSLALVEHQSKILEDSLNEIGVLLVTFNAEFISAQVDPDIQKALYKLNVLVVWPEQRPDTGLWQDDTFQNGCLFSHTKKAQRYPSIPSATFQIIMPLSFTANPTTACSTQPPGVTRHTISYYSEKAMSTLARSPTSPLV